MDLYSVEAYNENVADRLASIEAQLVYIEEKLFVATHHSITLSFRFVTSLPHTCWSSTDNRFNHSLSISEVSKTCEWDTVHVFGSSVDGGICDMDDMAAAVGSNKRTDVGNKL